MQGYNKISPRSWLAFDLNVLRRIEFDSIAIPFSGSGELGGYLKRTGVRVAANDPLFSAWADSFVHIANSREELSAEDIETILEDAYVPGYELKNPTLANWFSETDSWWLDNVRRNIDRLSTTGLKAIASRIAIAAGDYVFAFSGENRRLRQPLSNTFRRLGSLQPRPFDNRQNNTCSTKIPDDFIAETHTDLMFLRLPTAHAQPLRMHLGRAAWREEWIRGSSGFWDKLENAAAHRLGAPTETKSQYIQLLEETLQRASHIPKWAVAHVEDGFLQTQDIVDAIARIRRVDAIYTKDFSELTGTKAAIITA